VAKSSLVFVGLILMLGCGSNPAGPSRSEGSARVSGRFASVGAFVAPGVSSSSVSGPYDGIRVYVRESPSVSTNVQGDGVFTLTGVPSGTLTIVFEKDGRVIGTIVIMGVQANQEIRIIVTITHDDDVILVEEERDGETTLAGQCPRGAGFWCQNQNGGNPNLSAEQFDQFASEAAGMLASVPGLNTPEGIASAVCNTGDQLKRQLATLALNLAADTIEPETALVHEPYDTVGDAFYAGIAVANGGGGNRNKIKDILERINESRNTDTPCNEHNDGDDDDGTGELTCHGSKIPAGQLPPPGECKIWCPNIPAGQQGPPGRCSVLDDQVPGGCCLINHNGVVF
jgi:hypothetical protein